LFIAQIPPQLERFFATLLTDRLILVTQTWIVEITFFCAMNDVERHTCFPFLEEFSSLKRYLSIPSDRILVGSIFATIRVSSSNKTGWLNIEPTSSMMKHAN